MREKDIHNIWSSGLLSSYQFKCISGELIQILNPGELNSHSGPDFSNCVLKIDGIEWTGNIEIHINSSDWEKHKHSKDPSYENLLLHIVYINDATLDIDFPTLELSKFISEDDIIRISHQWESQITQIENNYKLLLKPGFSIEGFHDMALIRLERKAQIIEAYLDQTKNDWEEVFYRLLGRNMGFQVNTIPFEWLTRSLPLSVIRPHAANLIDVEALIFGQSGLLVQNQESDLYEKTLCQKHNRFQIKYQLNAINGSSWKFMRLRPMNFPTLRLAHFAAIIYKHGASLAQKVVDQNNGKETMELFYVSASSFWDHHFGFKNKTAFSIKRLGIKSIENILINTVIPFKYVYWKKHGYLNYKENTLSLLEQISPEQNQLTREWQKLGYKTSNALMTQALIELDLRRNIKIRKFDI